MAIDDSVEAQVIDIVVVVLPDKVLESTIEVSEAVTTRLPDPVTTLTISNRQSIILQGLNSKALMTQGYYYSPVPSIPADTDKIQPSLPEAFRVLSSIAVTGSVDSKSPDIISDTKVQTSPAKKIIRTESVPLTLSRGGQSIVLQGLGNISIVTQGYISSPTITISNSSTDEVKRKLPD